MNAGGSELEVAVAVAVDWLRRAERDLRRILGGRLRVEREHKRQTLGAGAVVIRVREWLRPFKDRRLSLGGIVCRRSDGRLFG